ncbi:hypothetical protein F5Y16DRAFT_170898 [Xylariaceae sp. FL0255]|nr:hypothetical protein F5Y16DRAFT_170898 [Xylariaceae sp. FL0255]
MAPHQNDSSPTQSQRNHLSKPQVFVQLSFGLSWSDRHVPRSRTYTYTSKNLKSARDSGHFPRQLSHPNARHESPQRRRAERHRGRSVVEQPAQDHHRGSSAPPPVLPDSPWDADATGPSATIFPRPVQRSGDPRHFRLGMDGMPWSDDPASHNHDDPDEPLSSTAHPVAIIPVPLSPPAHRRRGGVDDPQRTRDLEALSLAMMTVDNGFENQWWNQGGRQTLNWIPPQSDTGDDNHRHLSTADAVLLSAAEPPSGMDLLDPHYSETSLRGLVSPLSEFSSPSLPFSNTLQRSLSTRSDELWIS